MSRRADAMPLLLAALRSPALPQLSLVAWRRLLDQAHRCRLAGRLSVLATERGWMPQLPAGVRQHLLNVGRAVERKHLDTLWEGDRLLAALREVETPLVLLKGAAYVLAGLPAARGRDFSDVDILVRRETLREVELSLLAHGWVAKQLDPYDERYYRDWSHELPPLSHVERMTHLDVHHTLVPPSSRFAFDVERVLQACQPLPQWPGLSVLSPSDRVLHSTVHLMQEGDFSAGLRDLVDLHDLVLQAADDAGFWPGLAARARELALVVPLHDALVLTRDLLGLAVPAPVLAELSGTAGHRLRRRWVVGLLRRALTGPLRDDTGPLDAIAALLLYLRSHWLRMPLHVLLPHLARKAWMRLRRRKAQPDDAGPGGLLAPP